MLQTLKWTGSSLRLLDQTRLPMETVYVEITDEKQMWDAIKRLVVRGAPAIGLAAAFGVYLGIYHFDGDEAAMQLRVNDVCDYLATSRPTAVNLFWAIERVRRVALSPSPGIPGECGGEALGADEIANRELQIANCKMGPLPDPLPGYWEREAVLQRVLNECLSIVEEDTRVCRAIGEHGLALLRSIKSAGTINILTHCNAGALAVAALGTALAPVYVGAEQGVSFHVYSDETRPLLQGSRLTAFELKQNNIPVTVLCDNMAASLMSAGKIDAVIVGTDRVARNGDVANKIGTLGVAILAKHFSIPFIVAAPISSIDFNCASGAKIPIEQRDPREVTHGFGPQTAPDGVEVYNPAFDVTPAELVTAIITEKGIVRAPFEQRLRALA